MLLIQNAYIKPITGPDIPNGCLLADGGRIAAIAPHIDPPEGCTVIDAGGRLLTPGCVEAHCHIGLDNECLRWEGMDYNEVVEPLTPQLRAIDSINPQDGAFPNGLRGGVTTACTGPGSANVVGGTFTVLKLAGKIAKNAPIAVRNCKKAINDGISLPIEKAVEVEEKLFGDCFETHDQKEGMACFLSREKPKPKAVFTNN